MSFAPISSRDLVLYLGSLVDATRLSINDLMEFGYLELRFIIEWARKVPGK